MRRVKIFLMAAVLCIGLCAGITAAAASENLNLSADFWSGEAEESDGYLMLTTGGNEVFFGVSHTVTGNYTLEYEFKDMSPWIRAGGEWQNSKSGGEAWVVLGSKKINGQWQGDVRGNGSGGVCIRVTDGSMESYDFVGGPYPFYRPDDTPIPANTSWQPAGAFARLIDARLVYRYVVNSDERKVEIWAGFKGVSDPDLQLQYRGYLTYGDSSRTDGDFMMMFYNDTLIDNFKIEQNGETVFSLDFNGDTVPEEVASSLPQENVNVVNSSKTITTGNPLSSQFYVKWDFYKQSDYLFDNVFFAKSSADSDSLNFVFGKDDAGENVISFAKDTQTFSVLGEPMAATTAGSAAYNLTQGAYFRIRLHNDGLVDIYVVDKDLRTPIEHCPETLLGSYQLTREQVEGFIELYASGSVLLEGYTVGERSIGVNSVIRGIAIDTANFAGAKVGSEVTLSAIFDISSPVAENMRLFWSVDSGDADITAGGKLKINGTGAIVVRAVSLYDDSIYATATVYVPEIFDIVIDGNFDKAVGAVVALNALVQCKPNVEEFAAVKWQVIEGDADIVEGSKLKINSAGRVTVKAISLIDNTVNTEYTFIAGKTLASAPTDNGDTSANLDGLVLFIALTVVAAAIIAVCAVITIKNKKQKQ